MKRETEHMGLRSAFLKDLTPFRSPGWFPMDLTEQDPGILPGNSSTRPPQGANGSGRDRGDDGSREKPLERWKRLLEPCPQPPAHVRHPGEQHRGDGAKPEGP